MVNHVLLRKGGKLLLLVQYPDRYYLVTVDRKLTQEAEARLLSGSCSPQTIQELGLTCQTITRQEFKGVCCPGGSAGDPLTLYINTETLKYQLDDDFAGQDIRQMFPDIPRVQPPPGTGGHGAKDWRTSRQTESGRKTARIADLALNVVSIGCSVVTAITTINHGLSLLGLVACLGAVIVNLAVYLCFPQYFSILSSKEFKRVGYTAPVEHLDLPVIIPSIVLLSCGAGKLTVLSWGKLLLMGVVLGAVLLVILRKLSRELRENQTSLLAFGLVMLLFSCGLLLQLNHLVNPALDQTQQVTISETEKHRHRRGTSYDCTVVLENGEEVELSISKALYNRIKPGDTVEAYVGEGALGIRYGFVVGD